jgi:hypothetical protein
LPYPPYSEANGCICFYGYNVSTDWLATYSESNGRTSKDIGTLVGAVIHLLKVHSGICTLEYHLALVDSSFSTDRSIEGHQPGELMVLILSVYTCQHFSYRKRPSQVQVDHLTQIMGRQPRWYLAVVFNGTQNPYRATIAHDILNAIMKTRASQKPKKPATYWEKLEQEENLVLVFEKWARKGVWSAAASKVRSHISVEIERHPPEHLGQVHSDQLTHIQKGCLDRKRQDIASDRSRIESLHKDWNSLQRTHASRIVISKPSLMTLCFDANLRVSFSQVDYASTGFVSSTKGSHHIFLVNHITKLWNTLIDIHKHAVGLQKRPCLACANSGEVFGLIDSMNTTAFVFVKEEQDGDDDMVRLLEAQSEDNTAAEEVLEELSIDTEMLAQPLIANTDNASQQHTKPRPVTTTGSENCLEGDTIKTIFTGVEQDRWHHS